MCRPTCSRTSHLQILLITVISEDNCRVTGSLKDSGMVGFDLLMKSSSVLFIKLSEDLRLMEKMSFAEEHRSSF